jgi:hypothetical protein
MAEQIVRNQVGFAPEIAPFAQNLLGMAQGTAFTYKKDANGQVMLDDKGLPIISGFQQQPTYEQFARQQGFTNPERVAQFTDLQKQAFTGAGNLGYNQYSTSAATGLESLAKKAGETTYSPEKFGNAYTSQQAYDPSKFSAREVTAPQLQNYQMTGPRDVTGQVATAAQLGAAPTATFDERYKAQDMKAAQLGAIPEARAAIGTAAQAGPSERIGAEQFGGPDKVRAERVAAERVNAPQLQALSMQAAKDVSTQSLTQPGTVDQYMSPYMQSVVGIQQREAQRQADIARTQSNAQAVKAGAFGGSRQAIMDAEAARNLAIQKGDIQAKGSQDAFTQAQAQFNAEQQARLQANLANQGVQQQANVQNLSAGLQTQGLGAQTGLQAQQLNQQTGLQALLANQQTGLQADQGNQQMQYNTGLQNAQLRQQAALANQALGGQYGLQNAQMAQQTGMANLSNQQQAEMANQQMRGQYGLQQGQFNQQANQANQQAQNQFGLANQQAVNQFDLANQQMRGQYGLQQGQFNQAAAMQNPQLAQQALLANQNMGFNVGNANLQANLAQQQLGSGQNMQAQLANQQYGLSAQQMQEQARQYGYGQQMNNAQNQAQYGQAANQLNAQQSQFGAGLGLQGLQAGMSGYQNLGAQGQNLYNQNMGNLTMQNQFGTQQQQNVQNVLNNQYQDYLTAQNNPYKQMGFLSDMYRGAPLSTQGSTMYTTPPSMLNQLAGAGTAAYGAYKMFGSKKGGVIKERPNAGLAKLLLHKMA